MATDGWINENVRPEQKSEFGMFGKCPWVETSEVSWITYFGDGIVAGCFYFWRSRAIVCKFLEARLRRTSQQQSRWQMTITTSLELYHLPAAISRGSVDFVCHNDSTLFRVNSYNVHCTSIYGGGIFPHYYYYYDYYYCYYYYYYY